MQYRINSDESLKDYIDCIESGSLKIIKQIDDVISGTLNSERTEFIIDKNYIDKVPASIDDVINGKNKETNIVNISVKNDKTYIYKENNGTITCEEKPFTHWVLSPEQKTNFTRLKGNSHYTHRRDFSQTELVNVKSKLYRGDYYFIVHPVESYMIDQGYTYFKGMSLKDVSILSFDIETQTLNPNKSDAKILCIGNTVRKNGVIIKRIFRTDEYENNGQMLRAWCAFVREVDPSIMTGYNIVLFDLPYFLSEADRYDVDLNIGRDGSAMTYESRKKPRQFRKDGSQEYDYRRVEIFGREIIDMWMVTIKFDVVKKKYDSYSMKHIIKVEGLEKEGRVHYDASKIKDDWHDPAKRDDICAYCMDDSEDPIKLADMMLAPTFLLTAYIPKPFQLMAESNTGGQINALMVRSYLQEGWSIPKGDQTTKFQGAISEGFPGIYRNVLKADVTSLYPSIIRQYEIHPKKDYLGNFLKMIEFFAVQRIANKKIAEETKDSQIDALQEGQKVLINSGYGFTSTPGLNFNDMDAASEITKRGREVLETSILWASGRTYRDWVPEESTEENENEA